MKIVLPDVPPMVDSAMYNFLLEVKAALESLETHTTQEFTVKP